LANFELYETQTRLILNTVMVLITTASILTHFLIIAGRDVHATDRVRYGTLSGAERVQRARTYAGQDERRNAVRDAGGDPMNIQWPTRDRHEPEWN